MVNSENHSSQRGQSPQQIYDVLVVGGGPGGTAAAFRARELGLRCVVIEYDDLMKRIRDYSKSKKILPGFGGGDRMKFPKGGSMIDALQFGPIDKDEMCLVWKALYEKFDIEKRIGFELTGMNHRQDGSYEVVCWDHNQHTEQSILAKHVILALGNGVPRRLDIPGDTEGIEFRLRDPDVFVGAPACVIGGGTSAAEAVIAISNAKVEANDHTSVYWSYRGDRLPRVSRALAEVFFEAYVGNGNIRYFQKSEPAAVVTQNDQRDYLAIRVDRREMGDRPAETLHLEFPKAHCLACIGEDLPEALLSNLGIALVRGGPKNKKRAVVNRYLESVQPNVYMVGDILSQAYLCTDDFDGDPAGFQEIRHRGNIKTALRDGVFVAEIIKHRIEGKDPINVQVYDAEDLLPAVTEKVHGSTASKPRTSLRDSLPPVAIGKEERAVLNRVLPNGVVESEHPLKRNGVTTIGRIDCDIIFRDDPLLGKKHALISHDGQGYTLSCDDPSKDIFMVVPPATKLALTNGDLLRVGHQFLLVSGEGGRFWVNHYDSQGREVGTHYLTEKILVLGRESPDVTLDPNDRSLSRRHLTLTIENDCVTVKDLRSANHTFLRLRKAIPIQGGDSFQIGSELFVMSAGMEKGIRPAAAPIPAPVAKKPLSTSGSEPTVTFEGLGKTFNVAKGQTICDVAEANGVKIKAECHSGICGSDPIEIISGRENFVNEPSEGEGETLEDICDLKPGKCRLACMSRIKGPVVVRILED